MLETLFVAEIFTFLSWIFGSDEKRLDKKAMDSFKSKFLTSQAKNK